VHPLTHASSCPHESISQTVFAGLTIVRDRQTDRPRYSVCNNRPHLRSTAMRPNNKKTLSNSGEIINLLILDTSKSYIYVRRHIAFRFSDVLFIVR